MTWLRRTLAILASTWALSSCGGGGEQSANGSGVGTGGTGSYANGPVTAFGSIVVNGIHFEPGRALITYVDQPGAPLPSSALQLGMMVEVEASPLAPAAEGRTVADAARITITSQLRGHVNAIAGDELTVLGQPVKVLAGTTHLDAASMPEGLASLRVGETVEVYGFHDVRTDTFVATRLVKLDASVPHDDVLQGVVADLDVAKASCRIGHQMIHGFGASLPAGLRNGQTVRVLIKAGGVAGPATSDPSPGLPAYSLSTVSPVSLGLREAALDGLVSDIEADVPGNRLFRVNGVQVDARAMPSCTVCEGMQAGARIQVRGTLQDGKVAAGSVGTNNAP